MPSEISTGAAGAGIRASLTAAIAYDELCCTCQVEITFTAQAIIVTGIVTPAVARRVREIIFEIAGATPVWDRTIWV